MYGFALFFLVEDFGSKLCVLEGDGKEELIDLLQRLKAPQLPTVCGSRHVGGWNPNRPSWILPLQAKHSSRLNLGEKTPLGDTTPKAKQ